MCRVSVLCMLPSRETLIGAQYFRAPFYLAKVMGEQVRDAAKDAPVYHTQ